MTFLPVSKKLRSKDLFGIWNVLFWYLSSINCRLCLVTKIFVIYRCNISDFLTRARKLLIDRSLMNAQYLESIFRIYLSAGKVFDWPSDVRTSSFLLSIKLTPTMTGLSGTVWIVFHGIKIWKYSNIIFRYSLSTLKSEFDQVISCRNDTQRLYEHWQYWLNRIRHK